MLSDVFIVVISHSAGRYGGAHVITEVSGDLVRQPEALRPAVWPEPGETAVGVVRCVARTQETDTRVQTSYPVTQPRQPTQSLFFLLSDPICNIGLTYFIKCKKKNTFFQMRCLSLFYFSYVLLKSFFKTLNCLMIMCSNTENQAFLFLLLVCLRLYQL